MTADCRRRRAAQSCVVILTTFERDEYVFDALRSGASGFLLKNAPPEELLHAVHVVCAGEALLAPSVTRRIVEQFACRPVRPQLGTRLDALTQREREVLTMLAHGKSNAELAAELFVSEGTIKTHVSCLLAKLGLRVRVQAVVLAYESGLVTPGALSRLCPLTEARAAKICPEEERRRALRAMTGTGGGPTLVPRQLAPT